MITVQQVNTFCGQMKITYGANFRYKQVSTGMKVIGEYYTSMGQLMSIQMDVNPHRIEIKIYDNAKRLVYSDRITDNICYNQKLLQFIQKNVLVG